MWWGTPKIDCFDACPAFCSFKPRLPRPGLTLSTIPRTNGSSAGSRRSIRPACFQHTSQLPHKVTEHAAQDGGDYDEEERI